MTIIVSQSDNELASSGVEAFVQGNSLGKIGRGGSASTEIPDTDQCEVIITCGLFRRRMVITGDANYVVSWSIHPPDMVVTRK